MESIGIPFSPESENYVIAGLMITSDRPVIDQVVKMLMETDFYIRDYRLIFRIMKELYLSGQGIDAGTLNLRLQSDTLDAGPAALVITGLLDNAVSAVNLEYHCNDVKRCSLLRQAMIGIADLNDRLRQGRMKSGQAISEISRLADRLNLERRRAAGVDDEGSMNGALAQAQKHKILLESGQIASISTPWISMNYSLNGGFQMGSVALLSGQTGAGKSFALSQLVLHAVENGIVCGVINSEMRQIDCLARLLAIKQQDIVLADANKVTTMITITESSCWFETLPLIITPPATRNADEVLQEIRHLAESGVRLIVVDNLTDIIDNKPPYHWQPLFTRQCDDMSKRHNCLIMLATHLKAGIDGQPQDLMNSKRLETVVSYHITTETFKPKSHEIRTSLGTIQMEINSKLTVRKSRFSPSKMSIGSTFNSNGVVGFYDHGIVIGK